MYPVIQMGSKQQCNVSSPVFSENNRIREEGMIFFSQAHPLKVQCVKLYHLVARI